MSNAKKAEYGILDYVQDTKSTFDEVAFGEVDGLILTQISTMDLSGAGIDLGSGASLTIEELYEKMSADGSLSTLSSNNQKLLSLMAQSNRYRDMTVSNYVKDPVKSGISGFSSVGEHEAQEQFAAVAVTYEQAGEEISFLSFQSTDGSDDGWAEDFLMISSACTQAQADSVCYLNLVSKELSGTLTGGGHSKGGNDFEYGYLFCDEEVKERISVGYLYDSPGLTNQVLKETDRYKDFLAVTEGHYYAPQDSVVGLLLHENESVCFIHSCESDIFLEHDPYTWEIAGGAFVPDEQTLLSSLVNEFLDIYVSLLSPVERDAVYDLISGMIYGIDESALKDLENVSFGTEKTSQKGVWEQTISTIEVLSQTFFDGDASECVGTVSAVCKAVILALCAFVAYKCCQAGNKIKECVSECVRFIGENTKKLISQAAKAGEQIYLTVKDICEKAYSSFVSAVQTIWGNLTDSVTISGKAYAKENPAIYVDTDLLRSCSSDLRSLIARAKSLDADMNGLYFQLGGLLTGFFDLAKLLKGEIILGFAGRLDDCAKYLTHTADDFENAERAIAAADLSL